MTDSSAVAASPTLVSNGNWPWRIAVVAILTALADWLFFRQHVGISLALFVARARRRRAAGEPHRSKPPRAASLYAGILVAALLPSLEDFNVMSVLIAALGIGCFALGVTARSAAR